MGRAVARTLVRGLHLRKSVDGWPRGGPVNPRNFHELVNPSNVRELVNCSDFRGPVNPSPQVSRRAD